MGKYRKKPVTIDAWQWNGETVNDARDFVLSNQLPMEWEFGVLKNKLGLIIPTLEGDHLAGKGDFIIRGVSGEFYPCKPDIFAKTYEPVE